MTTLSLMRSASRPESLCPLAKNFSLASSATNGLVNMNTTTMSMSVVRPIANANPATPPTARKYSTTAAMNMTASAIRIVRRARTQADLDGRAQRAPAFLHLVTDAFEVDDERVGGDADRDDQADDVRQRQAEARDVPEHHHRLVGHDRRHHEAQHRDDAQAPVVEQRVDQHQDQADRTGDQTAA